MFKEALFFHLNVVPLSPATRERRQQCPLGSGLDLAKSALTLLTRNLRAKSCTGTNFLSLSLIVIVIVIVTVTVVVI